MSTANYARACRALWRHHDLGQAATGDHLTLVRYATLAASSHNTQPWRFRFGPGRVEILPDLRRRCPAVDPDDHHLFASLGCALENLLLAAAAAGLRGHPAWEDSLSGVRVALEPAPPAGSPLFDAIPHRQCTRAEYDGKPLTADACRLLQEVGAGQGIALLLLTEPRQRELVAEYVAAGNTAQFADPSWAAELRAWIRFNAAEALRRGDGLYGPVMGSPDVPAWLGGLFMRVGFSARRQNRKDIRHIRSSAAVAVFSSAVDDRAHWVEAGRCYQRFALQAAALGLRTAFINQPVEVPALRPQFATALGLGGRRPDLVVRVGRGPEMPRSLRRPVGEVLA